MKYLIEKLKKAGYLPEEDTRDNKSKYSAIIKVIYPRYKELAKLYLKLAYVHDLSNTDIAHLHKKFLYLRERRIVPDIGKYYKDVLKFVSDIDKMYQYHTFKRDGVILNNHPDFKSMLKNVKFVAIACLVKDPFQEETRYLTAFDALKKYGSSSWCITKCAGTFKNYSDNKRSIQYILISKKIYDEYEKFGLDAFGYGRIKTNDRFGLTVANNYAFSRKFWPFNIFNKKDKLICFNNSNSPVYRLSTLKRLTKRFPIEKVHNKLTNKFNIHYENSAYSRGRGITF